MVFLFLLSNGSNYAVALVTIAICLLNTCSRDYTWRTSRSQWRIVIM